MAKIRLRNEADYLLLDVDATPSSTSYWVGYILEIRNGPFFGKYGSQLPLDDLRKFGTSVKELYEKLTGAVEFDDLEGCLSLKLEGDGRGHINISGSATGYPGSGAILKFEFQTDQTFLPEVISSFSEI